MNNIGTSYRIAHHKGADLGYYSNKDDFFQDVVGKENSTFDCEILEVGSTFNHKERQIKIVDISIELHRKSNHLDSNVIVVIFIEYID